MTLLGNFVRTSGQGKKGDRENGKDANASFTLHRNGHEMENGASALTKQNPPQAVVALAQADRRVCPWL